jgi:hypothetical protein
VRKKAYHFGTHSFGKAGTSPIKKLQEQKKKPGGYSQKIVGKAASGYFDKYLGTPHFKENA